MLKKITILLLGLVVLSGCINDKKVTEEPEEMFTLTPRIQEIKTEEKNTTNKKESIIEESAERDVFYLLNSFQNADFDYNKIENFYNVNATSCDNGIQFALEAISPISGNYNIDYFLMTFETEDYYDHPGGIKHLVLAIKTDANNKIVDAYNRLYEHYECPNATLYKASDKIVKTNEYYLDENLDLNDLEFSDYIYFKQIGGGVDDREISFDNIDISFEKSPNTIPDFNFKITNKSISEKEILCEIYLCKPELTDCGVHYEKISDNKLKHSVIGGIYLRSELNGIYCSEEYPGINITD